MKKQDLILLFSFTIFLSTFFSNPSSSIGTIVIPPRSSSSSSSSSSSGELILACVNDNDCPPGICPNGQTYMSYSCLDGACHKLNFFADPCQFLTSSSSSGGQIQIVLNKKFTGTWKVKVNKCKPIVTRRNSIIEPGSNCKVCPLVSLLCISGFVQVPDTCNACSHCEKCSKLSNVTLKLCVKDGILQGTVHQPRVIENASIISQNTISENEVELTLEDKNGTTINLKLKLNNERELTGTLEGGLTFEARKLNSNKSCPVPICLSPDTRIRTVGVQKRIADIREGDLVFSFNKEEKKVVKVIKTSKAEVKNFKILKVTFNDGTVLQISPGHPTSDKRLFKELMLGDIVDNRMVTEIKQIPYTYKYTYDILPDSESGSYYANGILVGSTLKNTRNMDKGKEKQISKGSQ